MKPYDAAVIGGGVAGPALAAELAHAGRSVILFEKEKMAHDKVCGEFISHEGVRYLHDLGVSLEELGAVPIRHVRLARHECDAHPPSDTDALTIRRLVNFMFIISPLSLAFHRVSSIGTLAIVVSLTSHSELTRVYIV